MGLRGGRVPPDNPGSRPLSGSSREQIVIRSARLPIERVLARCIRRGGNEPPKDHITPAFLSGPHLRKGLPPQGEQGDFRTRQAVAGVTDRKHITVGLCHRTHQVRGRCAPLRDGEKCGPCPDAAQQLPVNHGDGVCDASTAPCTKHRVIGDQCWAGRLWWACGLMGRRYPRPASSCLEHRLNMNLKPAAFTCNGQQSGVITCSDVRNIVALRDRLSYRKYIHTRI